MSVTATSSSAGHSVDRVPVTTLANGHRLVLTVHTLHGASSGPNLVLFGGVHGDEPMGPEVVRRVLESVNPAELSGQIVAIPVANPYAYQAASRVTPQDGVNLNRIMPGDPAGSVTEQLAATLAGILDDGTTHFIDYHSGGILPCVDYSYLHDAGAEMSRAYGCRILYHHDSYVGSTTDYALGRGINCMVSELGGGSQRVEEFLQRGVTGTHNVLRTLGMLPGDPTPAPEDQVIVDTLTVLRPGNGGVLLSEFGSGRIGETLPAGTPLGRVISPYTFEELECITAPYDPTILVLTREAVTTVHPGDYGFMVADGATAKPAAV